jgi:N-acetylglucosaminyl-diphospho-decaprenol L-rhamnosyltransferase
MSTPCHTNPLIKSPLKGSRCAATVVGMGHAVDVVVVSYNSGETLRACVEPLATSSINVIVVDNASPNGGVETVADLPLTILALDRNYGFAYGCNRGWQAGTAPYVLFLNPDASIDPDAIAQLAAVFDGDETVGLAAPRLVDAEGSLDYSQRRFPRLVSTYAQALFVHRLFPRAAWVDELVRDPHAYESPRDVEWVSGACMLARRSALRAVAGWDEHFFLYGEDVDLCRRLWSAGYRVRFEPRAQALHIGGASAPRARQLPVLVAGRVRYVKKHEGPVRALLQQIGLALSELTHALVTPKGLETRLGHLRAAKTALTRSG